MLYPKAYAFTASKTSEPFFHLWSRACDYVDLASLIKIYVRFGHIDFTVLSPSSIKAPAIREDGQVADVEWAGSGVSISLFLDRWVPWAAEVQMAEGHVELPG